MLASFHLQAVLASSACKHYFASMSENPKPNRSAGGKARAEKLTPEQRAEIATNAASARWNKDIPLAPYVGEIVIGNKSIPCAVLEDGKTRIINSAGFLYALNRPWRGKYQRTDTPNFLAASNLKSYINSEIESVLGLIEYRTKNGGVLRGYDARLLRMVCNVYVRALGDGVLKLENQINVAKAAGVVLNALADVGVAALIDEATGFQRDRAKRALAEILEQFIAKELRSWTRTFPVEFYEQIFRLHGWWFDPQSLKRPGVIGHYTNDFIYSRLAPGVLDELRAKNPVVDGRRKHKLFQWLSGEVGDPRLRTHLDGIVRLMRGSSSWEEFKAFANRFFPRLSKTDLGFDVEDYSKEEMEAAKAVLRPPTDPR